MGRSFILASEMTRNATGFIRTPPPVPPPNAFSACCDFEGMSLPPAPKPNVSCVTGYYNIAVRRGYRLADYLFASQHIFNAFHCSFNEFGYIFQNNSLLSDLNRFVYISILLCLCRFFTTLPPLTQSPHLRCTAASGALHRGGVSLCRLLQSLHRHGRSPSLYTREALVNAAELGSC